jgi:hypothetical protein
MNLLLVIAAGTLGQVDDSVLQSEFPRITREWVDATGKFRVEAKLISVTATEAVLQKVDTQTVTVPLARLDNTSRAIAQEAYPHFLVEKKIRDIIEQFTEAAAAKEMSPRDKRDLQQELMAKANAELRRLKMRLRYRITEATMHDPKRAAATLSDYSINFVPLQDWQVTPDTWQNDGGLPAIGGYLRGWSFKTKELDPATIVKDQSVFEITGVPEIMEVGRDFSWRGDGRKIGADRTANVHFMISFALLKHEIRVFTPGR